MKEFLSQPSRLDSNRPTGALRRVDLKSLAPWQASTNESAANGPHVALAPLSRRAEY